MCERIFCRFFFFFYNPTIDINKRFGDAVGKAIFAFSLCVECVTMTFHWVRAIVRFYGFVYDHRRFFFSFFLRSSLLFTMYEAMLCVLVDVLCGLLVVFFECQLAYILFVCARKALRFGVFVRSVRL